MNRPLVSASGDKSLTVFNVAALGIGAMVGAGIFALLGQAALLVHSATWLSFAIGGVIALFAGYAYSCLGAFYPSRGGIITFFQHGLPSTVLSNMLSLLYLITLALTIAMVARAFGAYALQLFHSDPSSIWLLRTYSGGVILALVLVNIISTKVVGRTENVLVVIKLAILAVLILAGIMTIKPQMLEIQQIPSAQTLFSSVGLTFFAYAGFGMMANAADKVADPHRTMPRAFMLAIGVTIVLYISLSLVLLGNVSASDLAKYADTAVAQAASPILGPIGFTVVAIGALLATASAINATVFSAFNIMSSMGMNGTLPAMFKQTLWRQATRGNIVAAIVVLVLSLSLDLGSLANVASATFLICYLAVFFAAWRLRLQINASSILILCGGGLMLLVFVGFIYSLMQQGLKEAIIIFVALVISWLFALNAKRKSHVLE
ncbi:amino acid permease [Serratia fonticola]|uniref:APC family permease n=1 Tax=Serratia fonticola TaxID=47917 RepID=UPI0008FD4C8B|nr:APC family permease [Serratia fonticola]MBC3249780.1 amino acid permease [Serratia fonticola]OIX85295.1 amino acid permease [Serratia fonticola]QCR62535.1 amino acid permease [Serratia fonticola]